MFNKRVREDTINRVNDIERLIRIAHASYTEYTKGYDTATLLDYSRLMTQIAEFRDDRMVPDPNPMKYEMDLIEKMYTSMKTHSILTCRRAIKALDRDLAEEGIYPETLCSYTDPTAELLNNKLSEFKNNCAGIASTLDVDTYIRDFIISKVSAYITKCKNMPIQEFMGKKMPKPTTFVLTTKKECIAELNQAVDTIVSNLSNLATKYTAFLKSGDNVTIAEVQTMEDEIRKAVSISGKNIPSEAYNHVIQTAKYKLSTNPETKDIAKSINDRGWYVDISSHKFAKDAVNKYDWNISNDIRAMTDDKPKQDAVNAMRKKEVERLYHLPVSEILKIQESLDSSKFCRDAFNNLSM